LRKVLVVAEVALTLLVLIGAGLIFRSFLNLRQVQLGFEPENVLTAHLSLQGAKYADVRHERDFYNQLLGRIEAQPGVVAAGGVLIRPLEGTIGWDMPYASEGQSLDEANRNSVPNYEVITPHYFRAMGIPLSKGRDFTNDDKEDTTPVVIISETMARRIFAPGVDPLGRRIKLDPSDPEGPWQTIVGVVGDARYRALSDMRMDVYVPYLQSSAPVRYIVVRTISDPTMFTAILRRQIAELDPNQALTSVMTMDQLVSRSLARPRFNTLLLGFFAALATVLAGIGIYGIVSYTVTERTHELGIRIALGAINRDVLKLVIGQIMKLVLLGFVVGLTASFVLTRMVSSLLYGVTATDPLTFVAISLLLSAIAFLACLIPALRATRVDPMIALRHE
jgi:putative ABC transport system permease protein